MGCVLFTRSRTGVTPTADGTELVQVGRRFLALVDEVGQKFDREMISGHVRLGITDDIGLTRVPEILRHCAARFPSVEVELMVGYNSELLAAIEAQKLDLVLLTDGGPPFPRHALRLQPEPMAWVGRSDLGALSRPLPLVVSSEGCQWRARAIAALDAAGLPYRIACTSPSTSGQLAAARIGLGVSPMPRSIVDAAAGVEILGQGLPELPNVQLALVSGTRKGKAIRTLKEALLSSYGTAAST